MVGKILTNKPLREAIFEIRWKLEEHESGIRIDPHYQLLIGSFYEKVKKTFPFHQKLPTSIMPEEIAAYVVQHRFRTKKEGWPLVQLGPGILTVNETAGYIWPTFEKLIFDGLDAFFGSYCELKNNLEIDNLMLRYIDAIDFDFQNNAFEFLEKEMKINVQLPKKLFQGTGISEKPFGFNLLMAFESTKPSGAMSLRFGCGKKDKVDAIIWETIFQSKKNDAPNTKEEIMAWVLKAHNLTHDWFFKKIEGELEKRFE